jgi:hypothetical protein
MLSGANTFEISDRQFQAALTRRQNVTALGGEISFSLLLVRFVQ